MPRSKLSGKFRNRLLAALDPSDLALLEPRLIAVKLDRLKYLEHPNKKIDALYFVEHGIASVVAANKPDTQCEVGVIGCEGVSGVAVILAGDRSPNCTYMQVSGDGQRITTAHMREAMQQSSTLQAVLLRYAHTFMTQATHTALANAKASIEHRLARWLLMAHDRVEGTDITLTHEYLALMLGTRRPGVTEAVRALARRGLVRTERGVIVIADRRGLELRAGRYYGIPEAEYDRTIG